MGWFGRKSQTDAAPSGRQTIRFDNDRKFLSIPAMRYFGQYCQSCNDRYVLTWRDSTDDGSQGGARQSGPGRYLLLDDERIVVDGRLERPNDGKVSDAGTFILNDWHFFSSELSGTFCAFRPDGAPIVRQRFEANLYNNGLSSDGRYACCQTCNSGSETDSSVLTIFDLSAEKEVSRFMPESGWANGYDFSKPGLITLEYPDKAAVSYSLTGEFVDRGRWIEDGLSRGDLMVIGQAARDAPDPLSVELANRLIRACDVGLRDKMWRDPQWQAQGLRVKAECFDRSNRLPEALRCYQQALAANPKVGVKRRAQQIEKLLKTSN